MNNKTHKQINKETEGGDTLEIESKLKTVLGFYFEKNMQADSTIDLSEAEIQVLTELAVECPYKYGEAVYTARNILYGTNPDTLYVNSCEESYLLLPKSLKEQESVTDDEKEHFVVYPNPSTDNFVFVLPPDISGGRVEIYDLQGRPVGVSESFKNSGVHLLNGSGLGSGMYLYRVYDDSGNLIGNGKLEKL